MAEKLLNLLFSIKKSKFKKQYFFQSSLFRDVCLRNENILDKKMFFSSGMLHCSFFFPVYSIRASSL